jgi:hypothetical protein
LETAENVLGFREIKKMDKNSKAEKYKNDVKQVHNKKQKA